MPRIPPELCTRCKGYKMLCGLPRCPILDRFRSQIHAISLLKGTSVEGDTPPSLLVGEYGYPKVRLHYMIPPGSRGEEASYHEAPVEWSKKREPLSRIIDLRSRMVSATLRANVYDPWSLYEKEISIAAASTKPIDSEAQLARPPAPRLLFDGISKPVGPSAPVVRLRITSNPSIPRPAESAIWDDELASKIAVELYTRGVNVYTIQRMLSMGLLGRIKSRKLVPTRWAITAVDDMISNHLRSRVRDHPEVSNTEVYYGEYLGNRFLIIVKPGPGSFEWIEAWHPSGVWTRGAGNLVYWRLIEDPRGRSSASDGGFSAARLPILEYLDSRRIRGDVVILREILPSYYAPVGNWHIRETVRRALSRGPIMVDPTTGELRELLRRKTSIPVGEVARRSLLLGLGRRLARLTDFM